MMRLHPITFGRHRRGVAAVEFAFVVPILLLLLLGIWELGRIIHVQIIMNNAARDSARLAAQANIVATSGAYTQIKYNVGSPNVVDDVKAYLTAAGITNQNGLAVELQFVEPAKAGDPLPTSTTDDPYKGVKNQRFRLKVSLPYANVRWSTLSLINVSTLNAEVYWQCMVDDPFVVNTSLPGWSP
ncbi:MAG TPA: TadE/TadG family type IV pilus assembly protein [Gemmataceae bacterium]|nr:TadE/TadG family type IV pilus assembly protein [Gemmataceae bacterium]